MLKINQLTLKNYAGFNNEVTFDFTNQKAYKLINMFFGPNGCGKSTALNAIHLLGRAKAYARRDKTESNLLLRKLQFHPDYDPNYAGFTKYSDVMEVKGVFSDENKTYTVHIKDDDVVQNDLFDRRSDNTIFIDADNPLNLTKFQLPRERSDQFLDLAKSIYGYECHLEKPVASNGVEATNTQLKETLYTYATIAKDTQKTSDIKKQDIYSHLTKNASDDSFAFYQDLVICKGDVRVHYKSMSAGEKKIATLLRHLCDPTVMDKSDIVLVDNIEMHVYFKRHEKMIDKIIDTFRNKQFIVTSHSGIMIQHVERKYGSACLYDIPVYKEQYLVD